MIGRGFRAAVAATALVVAGSAHAVTCTDDTVKMLNAALLTAMQQGDASTFNSRKAVVEPVVRQAFDLPYLAGLVLGKNRDGLDDGQLQAFTDAFEHMVVATYAERFKRADGVQFIVRSTREMRRSRCAVRSVIARPGKPEVRIDYLLHERDGALRIINVVAQGVSDLALKRAEYGAVIEREGFAVLLEKLKAQTARLAGG